MSAHFKCEICNKIGPGTLHMQGGKLKGFLPGPTWTVEVRYNHGRPGGTHYTPCSPECHAELLKHLKSIVVPVPAKIEVIQP